MEKYKILKETKLDGNGKLPPYYRIEALKDFGDVKKGDIGGWVSNYENLSQDGNCWLYDNGKARYNARILDDATIHGNASAGGSSEMHGYSKLTGNACINRSAKLYDYAIVSYSAIVTDNAIVGSFGQIFDTVTLHGNSMVTGKSVVRSDSKLFDTARIDGESYVLGCVIAGGSVILNGNICNGIIKGNAYITSSKDFICISNIGSEFGTLTAYRTASGGISCTRGCFEGTLDQFEKAVLLKHQGNHFGKEYEKIIELLKLHFEK